MLEPRQENVLVNNWLWPIAKHVLLPASESNYLLFGDSRVGSGRSSHDIVGVREVDDDDLGLFRRLFPGYR